VAHAYNPSYSGGRDQEDCGSKPGQIVHENLSQKKKKKEQKTITHKNRAGGVAQGVGPRSSPMLGVCLLLLYCTYPYQTSGGRL
jgi:hypothetical protein